jgi:hypothetical protein
MSNISEIICSSNHQFIQIGEIQSSYGFFRFYFSNLHFYPNQQVCFDYCNAYFKAQFGYYRYDSYEAFKGGKNKVISFSSEPKNPLQSLEREFLIAWFKQCGFDTWTSFKAIVLHHFPEVTEIKLLEFWQNTAIDAHVLIRVNHVKQILG